MFPAGGTAGAFWPELHSEWTGAGDKGTRKGICKKTFLKCECFFPGGGSANDPDESGPCRDLRLRRERLYNRCIRAISCAAGHGLQPGGCSGCTAFYAGTGEYQGRTAGNGACSAGGTAKIVHEPHRIEKIGKRLLYRSGESHRRSTSREVS